MKNCEVVILLNFQTNLESLSSRRVGVYFYCFKITDKSYVHSEVTPLISNYNTITIQRFEKSGTRTSTSSKQRPHFGANIPTTSHHITLQRSSKLVSVAQINNNKKLYCYHFSSMKWRVQSWFSRWCDGICEFGFVICDVHVCLLKSFNKIKLSSLLMMLYQT